MAVGNSETGGVVRGAIDSQSAAGSVVYGGLDSQALRGGATYGAYDSQALRGGVTYGAYDSQSLNGNATRAGLSVTIPGTTSSGGLQIGFFFKVPSTANYGTGIMLCQLGLPSNGYVSLGLQNNATIWYGMVSGSFSNQQNPAWTVSPNTWYYLTYCLGTSGASMVQRCYVFQNGLGWQDSGQVACGTAVGSDASVAATLGVGCMTSTTTTFAGWQHFPNRAGWEIGKLWLRNGNTTGIAWGGPTGSVALPVPPTDAAISALSPLLFYSCVQTVGAAATLVDATVNANNAMAGPYGLTIATDGPYG